MPMRLTGKELSCIRGGRRVLTDIAFAVSAGQGLLLEGPNGSGKTTLLRALAGLVPFCAGTVIFEGGAADTPPGEQAHYVGHADAIKPQLSVRANLAFWADYLGGGDSDAALALFDLAAIADLPAAYLSAGQKRKLALSRLKLVQRPLWLLDEPNVSLDAAARGVLAGAMNEHMQSGGIVIAATHLDLGALFAQKLTLGRSAA